MMYVHSVERAVRDYPDRPALSLGDHRLSFQELHDYVTRLAAALFLAGFKAGDRLALLLPNGPEYIQFVYACSRLAIIVVPINSRLSAVEIDHILEDSSPAGTGAAFISANTERAPSVGTCRGQGVPRRIEFFSP